MNFMKSGARNRLRYRTCRLIDSLEPRVLLSASTATLVLDTPPVPVGAGPVVISPGAGSVTGVSNSSGSITSGSANIVLNGGNTYIGNGTGSAGTSTLTWGGVGIASANGTTIRVQSN